MGEFDGRVAIVTGAAQGIGLATVEVLSEAGAAVLAFDRDRALLEESVGALRGPGRVEAFVGDVTDKASVEAAVATAERSLGPVDIMVNNAGIWIIKSFLDYTDEDFDRTLTINLRGTWLFMKAVAPGMVERRRGVIVNLASVAAFTFTVAHAAYAASKAAVSALTRDVAFELAPFGIRVNAIAPGSIVNPRRGKGRGSPTKGQPLGTGEPKDIANAIKFLCQDGSRYIVGQTIRVAGGGDLSVTAGWGPVEAVTSASVR